MLDLKTMKSAFEQLEEERKIPKEKIENEIKNNITWQLNQNNLI